MKEYKISVVIPAFNEEKYIEVSLESFVNQNIKDFELILIDNNSTDNTVKIAERFKNVLNLKIINEKKQGRGAARARGFNEAKGDIILSADADTIVYPDWIETLTGELKGDVVATTTPAKITDCSALKNMMFNFLQPQILIIYRIFSGHFWVNAYSFAILKSAYLETGGFNPNLQAQEDVDLSFKIAKIGKVKLIRNPVIFSGRRFKDGVISGFFEYFRTFMDAFVFKKKYVFLDNPR